MKTVKSNEGEIPLYVKAKQDAEFNTASFNGKIYLSKGEIFKFDSTIKRYTSLDKSSRMVDFCAYSTVYNYTIGCNYTENLFETEE